MPTIIDRRLNPKDKTIKNRQKFVQRSKEQIKKSVKDAIDSGNITDIENGKAKIKVKGISEPEFAIKQGSGNKKYIMPGNDTFVVGDKQEKEKSGQGKGNGPEGGLGQGEDDFEFVLNQEEFLNFIFEDLELPDLVKKQMKDVTKVQMKRAGFTNVGNPSQLDIVRSLKNSLGRRIGLNRPKEEDIESLEEELLTATPARIIEINLLIEELKSKQMAIPWLDPFDVRYRAYNAQPQPMTKAVMFCIMDVSGSMGQTEKDLAKRFFFFLYMFLTRKYQKVEIIFIRHHETASEVGEDEFFNSRESGGTVVSGALDLTKKIIDSRYNINDWNIYVSQVSDGDNYSADSGPTKLMMEKLLPIVQYFAYVEIKSSEYYRSGTSDLLGTYNELEKEFNNLHIRTARDVRDIWKVFKELFSKEKV